MPSNSAAVGGGGGGLEGFNLVAFGGPPFATALPMRGCREAERCSVIPALESPEPCGGTSISTRPPAAQTRAKTIEGIILSGSCSTSWVGA